MIPFSFLLYHIIFLVECISTTSWDSLQTETESSRNCFVFLCLAAIFQVHLFLQLEQL